MYVSRAPAVKTCKIHGHHNLTGPADGKLINRNVLLSLTHTLTESQTRYALMNLQALHEH